MGCSPLLATVKNVMECKAGEDEENDIVDSVRCIKYVCHLELQSEEYTLLSMLTKAFNIYIYIYVSMCILSGVTFYYIYLNDFSYIGGFNEKRRRNRHTLR